MLRHARGPPVSTVKGFVGWMIAILMVSGMLSLTTCDSSPQARWPEPPQREYMIADYRPKSQDSGWEYRYLL